MRIFGISLTLILAVAFAYWAGSRNMLGRVVGAVAG